MVLRFIKDFPGDVRAAAAAALRNHTAPQSTRLVTILVAVVSVYIAAAVVLVPAGKVPAFNFVDERGAITALSAVFLAMACGFAFAAFLISADADSRHRFFWLTMGVALGYLALDELLEFHERIGDRLDQVAALRTLIDQTPIRNWNDVIVILYGVAVLPAAVFFLPSVVRFPAVFRYLFVAGLLFVAHTAVDSVVEPPTTVSIIFEESAKLFCSTFIAIAFLVGLLGMTRRITSSASAKTSE